MRKINLAKEEYFNSLVAVIIQSNLKLEPETFDKIKSTYDSMKDLHSKNLMGYIVENCQVATEKKLPICQDTGILEVFVKIGRNVFLEGNLENFINKAAAKAYSDGYFRKSVVSALTRENTKTNTPAIIHFEFIDGDNLEFYVVPKGFGAENMTTLKMFNPTASSLDIVDFILQTVKNAGPNPCPPLFLGIGIGGTSEKALLLAKKAQSGLVEIEHVTDEELSVVDSMKSEIIKCGNELWIGPFGLGGEGSVLNVNINVYPTHIAGLPVAVTFGCWCNRLKKLVL
ncbi:MAG: fumarate hydratase [bacterium]|nr:fumarate hydratase [bacterium]